MDEPKGVVGTPGRASTLPTAPNLAVFPWTQECGRCPMSVQERWARSRTTRSTLIWGIPVKRLSHKPRPTEKYLLHNNVVLSFVLLETVSRGRVQLHPPQSRPALPHAAGAPGLAPLG